MVMRHRVWLVINRNGEVNADPGSDAAASIRSVCQSSSLKMSTSPRSGSFKRVIRKFVLRCQFGVRLSSRSRDIYRKTEKVSMHIVIKWRFVMTDKVFARINIFQVSVRPWMIM